MKRLAMLLIALALVLCACCAQGEMARIETGRGSLNMRRKPRSNADVVLRVPNQSIVELEEESGSWSRITYNGKSGYVKSEFIRVVTQEELDAEAAAAAEAAARKEAERQASMLPNDGFGWIETEGGSVNIRKKADESLPS